VSDSETPTLVDSMGRDLFAGDVVMIPGAPVKWIIDSVEIGSKPGADPIIRIAAHADFVGTYTADRPVAHITRACPKKEKAELDANLQAARMRAAPSIIRPN